MFAVLMSTLMLAAAPADPSPAAGAPAANAAAPPAAGAAAEKPKPTDQVCWTEKPTGSHIAQHFCATREQVEKAVRDGQAAVSNNNHYGRVPGFRPS